MSNPNDYPGLSTRPAMISALLLILWGAFTIGIQTYVYVEFATKFEDAAHGGVDEVWRDAYNGLCLANGILCMLGGLFCFVTIPNRSASTLTTSLILAVLGSLLAAGSVVLSALQSRILDETNNGGLDNKHPCINPTNTSGQITNPDENTCLDWFALQLTVTALSGLAFLDFFVIVFVVARGLSSGRGSQQQTPIPAQSHYQGANGVKPYQAYNNHAMVPDIWDSQPTSMNPRYSQHLQQLNQQQPGKPVNGYQNQYENNQQESMTIQRGQLQVLHNQRHRMAPPPAPVAPHTSYSRF